MRTFISILVGIVFVGAFCVSLALYSVVSYATDPAAVVETARHSNARGLVVALASEAVADAAERSRNPRVVEFLRQEGRGLFAEVLDEEWFYSSLGTLYSDVPKFLTDGDSQPVESFSMVDVQDKKKSLHEGMVAIATKLGTRCSDLLPSNICQNEVQLERLQRSFQGTVIEASSQLPRRVSLDVLLARAGKDWYEPDSEVQTELRRIVATVHLTRMAALVVMLVSFLLVVAINFLPPARLLAALGWLLAVAAGIYLAAVYIAGAAIGHFLLGGDLSGSTGLQPRPDAVGDAAVQTAETLITAAARAALHHADAIAITILIAGFATVLASRLLGPRPKGA